MNCNSTSTKNGDNLQIMLSAALWSVAVSAVIFSGSASLPGNDVFYHLRMAELVKSGNIALREFPWTTCSIWSHPFFNKEWLFHIYLLPFITIFGTITGAKVAISVTAFLIALAWGRLLKALGIKSILFAMLFMLFCTGYVYPGRLILCRSFLLSILLLPIAIECVIRRKRILLVIITYIYMLSYVGAWQMIPIVAIFDIFNFRSSYKNGTLKKDMMLPWATLGVILGFVATPYFPVNLKAVYMQTILILKAQWFGTEQAGTLPMGTELAPIPAKNIICYIGLFALFAFMLYDFFNRKPYRENIHQSDSDEGNEKRDEKSGLPPVTKSFLLLSTIYLVMTIFTQKFIEYLAPFFTVTTFLYWSRTPLPAWDSTCPFYTPKSKADHTLSLIRRKVVIALLIISGIVSTYLLRENFYRKSLTYSDSSRWIAENIPKESLIFAGDWDDNVILFYFLHDYKFLVMLDPYFMYAYSPKKFIIWQKIVSGKVENCADAIQLNFKTNVVFVPPDRPKFKHRLLMDDKARLRYEGKSGESVFILEKNSGK